MLVSGRLAVVFIVSRRQQWLLEWEAGHALGRLLGPCAVFCALWKVDGWAGWNAQLMVASW